MQVRKCKKHQERRKVRCAWCELHAAAEDTRNKSTQKSYEQGVGEQPKLLGFEDGNFRTVVGDSGGYSFAVEPIGRIAKEPYSSEALDFDHLPRHHQHTVTSGLDMQTKSIGSKQS